MRSPAEDATVLKPLVKPICVSQQIMLFADRKVPGCLAMVLVAPLFLVVDQVEPALMTAFQGTRGPTCARIPD